MEKYDYYEVVISDLTNALNDDDSYMRREGEIFDEWCERVCDLAVEDDSVTGFLTGSYTCNANEAKRYVLDNFELCIHALHYLDYKMPLIDEFLDGIEEIDTIIRQYVVFQVYRDVCFAYVYETNEKNS